MSNDLGSLNEEHIRHLGRIVETLEKSGFDFLQVEVGDLKVTVGKGDMPFVAGAPGAVPAADFPSTPPAPVTPEASSVAGPAPAPATTSAPAGPADQALDIPSPMMGIFYAQPEPGAAPFVTVGSIVSEDTTVGLVEVMKTFNAVTAGVGGRVVEICAADAELVEYGQVLFRVAPE